MGIHSKSVKVLRLAYRMTLMPTVRELSPPARLWLEGVTLQWTGYNNGVLEFTQERHGTAWGLGDTRGFNRARSQVLATGLVTQTRKGGRGLPALYCLTAIPIQAPVPA